MARQTYKETTDDVSDLVTYYAQKHELALKTVFEVSSGFRISLALADLAGRTLPVEFVNAVKKGKNMVFTTLKLVRHCLIFN